MKQIENITDDALQIVNITLDDGTVVNLTLNYLAAIQRWKFDLVHPNLELYGKILCFHPNMLRQFKKKINFGLGCLTTDGVDPINVEDFINQRATLFILSKQEVDFAEGVINQ